MEDPEISGFSPQSALIAAVLAHLRKAAAETVGDLGSWDGELAFAIEGAAALQGPSDAPYHNLEHTLNAALAGADMLRGVAADERLTAEDWTHVVVALLLHDMGYVRGACAEDRADGLVISASGDRVALPRGASDGALGPFHVTRSMIHARERLSGWSRLDLDRVVRAIGCTRFPPPPDTPIDPASEGGLVRAADLISQLGDPRYVPRMSALFQEFCETGQAKTLGLSTAADLVDRMSAFHAEEAAPLIGPALEYLGRSVEGNMWMARMDRNLRSVAMPGRLVGPAAGPQAAVHG